MRRNPPAKWVLPLNIHPATSTEWCVPVPDDPYYRAAFVGALANLGAAYKWQDDPTHKAVEVAQVWRDIADALERCMSEQPILRAYEDDTMPFRVDCDCNVFVTCCDGTEIQLATLATVQQTNQPGSGSRPAPGQSTCYQRTLNAQNSWLLPFAVNTGDVLTVTNLNGAWSSDGLVWTCPDGTPFVAGACVGTRYHLAGDPSGTLYHGQLAYLIAGVYYSATDGAFTVPSGIVGAQVLLVPNMERTLSAAGDITFKVCGQNGGTAPVGPWCYTFDFISSDAGWAQTAGDPYGTTWTPGVGWQGGFNGGTFGGRFSILLASVMHGTGYKITLDNDEPFSASGGQHDLALLIPGGGGTWHDNIDDYEASIHTLEFTGNFDVAAGDYLGMDFYSVLSPTFCNIKTITIYGTGTNPFGADNC